MKKVKQKLKARHFLIFVIFFIYACSNDNKTEPNDSKKEQVIEVAPAKKSVKLFATMDHLRVRDTPDLSGETVYMLSDQEEMEFLEVQDNVENISVNLRGFPYKDPWIKVKMSDGTKGWVYGGGVRYEGKSQIGELLRNSRLEALFGKENAISFLNYKRQYDRSTTSSELAKTYRLGISLRDATEDRLHEHIEVSDPTKLPDMTWLSDAIPGFIQHLVAEGTMFHMFVNFKEFAKKARRTAGPEDDQFMELGLKIFPIDSIEHFFPAWFMQTWDYGGHSELGAGIHNDLLAEMNQVLAHSAMFEEEIETYKDQILHDITDSHITYWQPKDAILSELDEILAADYGILNEEDKIALKTRRKLFENPESNGIELNNKSGVHN